MYLSLYQSYDDGRLPFHESHETIEAAKEKAINLLKDFEEKGYKILPYQIMGKLGYAACDTDGVAASVEIEAKK